MIIRTTDRPISNTMNGASPAERIEPISLAWAKLHLRFPSTAEDTLLATYLAAARADFEQQTRRQCVDATWEYALDGGPDQVVIELPRPPLASVVSVTYHDAAGVAQTFDAANYVVHTSFVVPGDDSDPVIDPYCPCGLLELVAGASWPTTSGLSGSLRIRRVCGYGATAEAMPQHLVETLGQLVQHAHSRSADRLPQGTRDRLFEYQHSALPVRPPTRAGLFLPE